MTCSYSEISSFPKSKPFLLKNTLFQFILFAFIIFSCFGICLTEEIHNVKEIHVNSKAPIHIDEQFGDIKDSKLVNSLVNETSSSQLLSNENKLFFLRHRLVKGRKGSFEPLFPFEYKGFLQRSKLGNQFFFNSTSFLNDANNDNNLDQSASSRVDKTDKSKSDSLLKWNEKFINHPDIDIDTVYQIQVCYTSEENFFNLKPHILSEEIIFCPILKSISYCNLVNNQWKEHWNLHGYIELITLNGNDSKISKLKYIYPISIDFVNDGKYPYLSLFRETGAQDEPGNNELIQKNEQCKMILKKQKQLLKYEVKIISHSGTINQKQSYNPMKEVEKVEATKEAPKPWYIRYWYLIAGFVIIFLFTLFTTEEESK